MNYYGEMARDHWARWLPGRYATIEDPNSFFWDSGEPGRDEDRRAGGRAGRERPAGRGLPGRRRLGQARRQAEEIVLREMILLEPEPEPRAGPGRVPLPGLTPFRPRARTTWRRPVR